MKEGGYYGAEMTKAAPNYNGPQACESPAQRDSIAAALDEQGKLLDYLHQVLAEHAHCIRPILAPLPSAPTGAGCPPDKQIDGPNVRERIRRNNATILMVRDALQALTAQVEL